MGVQEAGWVMEWFGLTHKRDRKWTLVKAEINLLVA